MLLDAVPPPDDPEGPHATVRPSNATAGTKSTLFPRPHVNALMMILLQKFVPSPGTG
jgi:hypothetical protein